jgi:hypothetical protein
MAKKSLGFVQLEWTCPNCSTRNPGPQKVCSSCGGPQPDNVQFEQPAQEKMITDQAKIEQAKAGPDIHCRYCGTRNAAAAETCTQCGAALKEGTARAGGQVLGAHRTGPAQPVNCPACGTPNAPDAPTCGQCGAALTPPRPQPVQPVPKPAGTRSKLALVIIGLVILLLCALGIGFMVLSGRTEDTIGRVSAVNWTRQVSVEALAPVQHESWQDEIPAGAEMGSCSQKVRHTQDEPAPNADEVCGTPYTVDTGSGYGEVTQDCQYRVYADWCQFTMDEWRPVDQLTLSGDDLLPQWPGLTLQAGQREGKRAETYTVVFNTDGGQYTYTTTDPAAFSRFQVDSQWVLTVNAFNAITGLEPVR